MAPLDSDPHNHAPPVTADDEWADACGAGENQFAPRPVLPPRRVTQPAESAAERIRTTPEMGLHIDVARPVSRLPANGSPPTIGAADDEVVKLEPISSDTVFQAKQTIAAVPQPQVESSRELYGEGREWGKQSKRSNRWVVTSAVGVVLLVVVALVFQHLWLRDPKPATIPIVAIPEDEPIPQVVGFELDGSSETEARELLATYAKATSVAAIIPLIRNGEALAARLQQDWQSWQAPPTWQTPAQATWSVSADGGRNHGLLKGSKPDFSRFRAYFIREEGGLKLDWEATQGSGDASFETLLKGQGTGGKVRVFAKLDHFVTEIFPEEAYHSFRLTAPDGEQVIWAYSSLGSPTDVALMQLFEPSYIRTQDKSELPITVRLEPGPAGCQKNQWLIGEMLHIDWVSP